MVDADKQLEMIVPDLTGFKVRHAVWGTCRIHGVGGRVTLVEPPRDAGVGSDAYSCNLTSRTRRRTVSSVR